MPEAHSAPVAHCSPSSSPPAGTHAIGTASTGDVGSSKPHASPAAHVLASQSVHRYETPKKPNGSLTSRQRSLSHSAFTSQYAPTGAGPDGISVRPAHSLSMAAPILANAA